MYSLSVIIPAYNEEANVQSALEEVDGVCQGLGMDYEIILVNDGSRDHTGEIVRDMLDKNPNLRLVEHFPNRGYGGALKAGFAAAGNPLVAFFPADRQFHFSEIHLLLAYADQAEIVCGYRQDRQDPWIRRLNAFGWNSLVRLLFGYLSRDIDCGFKLFHRWVLSAAALESDGAMIDTELLASARARHLRIAEVPVTHLPRQDGAATGANPRVILRAFRDLLRFRLRLSHQMRHLTQA